jgi:hypothetical protein
LKTNNENKKGWSKKIVVISIKESPSRSFKKKYNKGKKK